MLEPVSEADARLITGDPRAGKNAICVAWAKDDYWLNLNGLMVPNNSGQILKAKSLKEDDWETLKGVPYHPFKYVKIYSDDEKHSKIIKIPKGYFPLSPVKIFANFHLYGLRYAYVDLEDVIGNLDSDLFTDAWVISDEGRWLDKRFNMTSEGKEAAKFIMQVGKRHLKFLQIVQYTDMIETRYNKIVTKRVWCTYNKDRKEVTGDITQKGQPNKSVTFYLPYYWHNFDTDERVPTGQRNINRALKHLAAV